MKIIFNINIVNGKKELGYINLIIIAVHLFRKYLINL